jgi:N-acetylmuramoyl-L-alanine amidase
VAALLLHASIVSCKAQARQGADQSTAIGEWTTEVARRPVVVTDARLVGDGGRTQFLLTVSQAVRANAFPVANPPRVIIDLPDVEFRLDPVVGQRARGLVTAYRYGLLAPGKSRIVLDTAGPVRVEKAEIRAGKSGQRDQLAVELVKADTADFEAARPPPLDAPPNGAEKALPPPTLLNAKPVIIIDPGHGGLDPGAVGAGGLLEKNLVMAVSRHLRAVLAASGRYTVVMTRNSDIFVSLDQRLRLTRKYGADLFVSIHADAVGAQNLAPNVRGATVYTLSEQASDEQARRLAEKENAADVLAGLVAAPPEDRDDVRNILIDLLRQETANHSADFQTLLIGELRKRIALAREPQRSAAFRVLKQTHSPAVLIELGYMSNAEDQKQMKAVGWQTQVAGTIAAAIDAFFAKRAERTHH